MSAQDYYGSSKVQYNRPNNNSQTQQYSQHQQNRGYQPQQQQQYQQPPQYYQQPQQPQYYQQPQQPIYVQQQPPQRGNDDCLTACLAAMCVCLTLNVIF
ncbi:similar to Saccharomyces cerevisiae YBR016W Tail-anchored plasma membrane protein containing a conserved CYSTM module [Maudiozyma saulgeensis]|uniref:Similar to Saccharomyces cerevisiae YBR016W Tail-anchored plasma membrane protein containing a conserved CYSTM module n=1 Tax=Maudiozyma saulgeensis TaxID=1789683 RepID=A0A1X7RBE1_9SACH|nr:similar to Saccharomyces cerevisiae YBR016W Tail-anchored plasma membrane protein containing a conserved CYSTM module [Kazachstania saulgeensis]